VKVLLENGTDLESKGNLDQTSLLRAAAYEHKMVAKEKGSFRDDFGRTPLLQAAASGYKAVARCCSRRVPTWNITICQTWEIRVLLEVSQALSLDSSYYATETRFR
jgi:hypothetical protein